MIIRRQSSMNVVEAAYMRVKNIFSNGLPVYLSTSGGKDSICLMKIVYDLIERGEVDPRQLTINFIDEEAMYDDVIEIVKKWRKRFMMKGAKFNWFCIEVVHFNCLNQLADEETYICWDRYQKDKWVRPMPKFAITDHPLLKARQENYQSFLPKIESDGLTMIGVRAAESIQRLQNLSKIKKRNMINGRGQAFPIYDWSDRDVWQFIKENNLEIPRTYLYLYQSGVAINQLRISQFFAIDTVRSLLKMNEYYPDLMERVERREPNAYLVALYWDTEMFRRSTRGRRQTENKEEDNIDYHKELIELFTNIPKHFNTEHSRKIANDYKRAFFKMERMMTDKHKQKMYESLIAGDTKKRTLRAIIQDVYGEASREARKQR